MKMNSLLGKILLALLASTLLALLLVSFIQRNSFKRGFSDFLRQQEEVQLSFLIPELQGWYSRRGSWESLRGEPRRWLRLLARTRPEGISPPEDALLEQPPDRNKLRYGPGKHDEPPPSDELRRLWRRMFLLDERRLWVAGARPKELYSSSMQAVEVGGSVVGWLGFVSSAQPAAPEARRFLMFQRNTLLASAGIALLVSALLGFLLARHLSRPVVALRDSVQSLTAGDFSVRNEVKGGDEIASLARHINRLGETLQANESARRRWTADMAHELRTPIAILQAEIEAARDGIRPNLEATLDSLHEEVMHLSRLVNDLQALSLADAGALNMRLADTDVAAVLRQALEAVQEHVRQAGLKLEVDVPDHLVVQADAQRLRQLLLNLLENSCRYTDAGGEIKVHLQRTPSGVELVVADSAPGLDAAQRGQLFERFYRAENSRGRAGGGSGLGLSICREIVLAHGGTIAARPSELGGLAVVVNLPARV
ncbi:MAG: ATP-binding protein [Xanthomonadales bacterium]|nr:ATP-binding protein [Xanthomonadales bacterium]